MCVVFYHEYLFLQPAWPWTNLKLHVVSLCGCPEAAEKRSVLQRRSWSLTRKGKKGRALPGCSSLLFLHFYTYTSSPTFSHTHRLTIFVQVNNTYVHTLNFSLLSHTYMHTNTLPLPPADRQCCYRWAKCWQGWVCWVEKVNVVWWCKAQRCGSWVKRKCSKLR